MDIDDILDVMSSYDFKEPLKTVIIMEDNEESDDDKESNETENQNRDQLNGEVIDTTLNQDANRVALPLQQDLSKRRASNNEPHRLVTNSDSSPSKRMSDEKQYDERCKRKCSEVATDINKQNDYKSKSEFYIKSTLRIVSENLLHIVASKAQVQKNYYNKNSVLYGRQDLVEKHIISLKYSFFKMTYSVTVTILLPLENNKMFIKTLLLSSLTFGNTNGIYTSYEELYKIYSDMLMWTKDYRYRYVPPLTVQEYTPYSATGTPPTNPEIPTHLPTTNHSQKPVQSNTPPYNSSTSIKKQGIHQPPSYVGAINHSPRYSISNSLNDRNLFSNYQYTNAPSVSSTNSSTASSLPKATNIHTTQNAFHPQLKTTQDQSVVQINYQANTIFSKTIIPSEVETPSTFQQHMPPLACLNTDLNDLLQPPRSCDVPAPNVTITDVEPWQGSTQQGQHYDARSSISRDSGFMSPVQSANEMQVTPYITEVTSLNPNVKHVNIGSCVVCQKSTGKVCLGCYKEYYCSFECMITDPDDVLTFVAKDLHKLPPVKFDHVDVTRLLKDITILKASLADLVIKFDASQDTISELRAEVASLQNTTAVSRSPEARNVNARRGAFVASCASFNSAKLDLSPPAADFARTNGDVCVVRPPPPPAEASPVVVTSTPQRDYAAAASRQQPQARDKPRNTGKGSGSRHDERPRSDVCSMKPDKDGFFTVERKKKKKPLSRNQCSKAPTGLNFLLRPAVPVTYMYISRLHYTTKEADVMEYLEKKTKIRDKVEKLEARNNVNFNSFVVRVPLDRVSMYLQEELWPKGVVFRKFGHPPLPEAARSAPHAAEKS